MLKRFCADRVREHLKKDGQALLVTGARQVGKTFLIRTLCEESGVDYFEFNLIERPEVCEIFNRSKNAADFLQRLRLIAGRPVPDGSILFFDEIQEAKDAVTLIKFLVDEGSFHYVFSGSLLGVELQDVRSAPVGYLHEIEMYPLNFAEFLTALGVHEQTLDAVAESFRLLQPVEGFLHEKLTELFYLYLMIGGMPQAVQAYVDTNNLEDVATIHRDIIAAYKRDFTRYEKRDKLKLIAIYDSIPSELNKQNKRYVFTYLNKEMKFDRYENSFLWLKDAGVAIPVYNAQNAQVPLIQSRASNLFKLFMNDVGLLTSHYSNDVKLKILNRENEINYGALFENAAAQLFCANGLTPYYFKNSKTGEVDFLIERDGVCVPVEVKSGKNYRSHRALQHLLDRPDITIPEAYVFADANVSTQGRIRYLPVYMLGLIKDSRMINPIVRVDVGGL